MKVAPRLEAQTLDRSAVHPRWVALMRSASNTARPMSGKDPRVVRVAIRLGVAPAERDELATLAMRIAEEYRVSVTLSSSAHQLVASFAATPIEKPVEALVDCLAVATRDPFGLEALRRFGRMMGRRAKSRRGVSIADARR